MAFNFGWVAPLFLIIFGVAFLSIGYSHFKKKRLVENIPTSKTRSVALGLVEVFGKALPTQKPFIAPLTQRECVWCTTTIERYEKHGKSSSWVVVDSNTQLTPFWVKDDTGEILVHPHHAEMSIPNDFRFESGFGRPPLTSELSAYAKARGIGLGTNFSTPIGNIKVGVPRLHFTEKAIETGQLVYVMGTAQPRSLKKIPEDANKENGAIFIGQGKNDPTFYISDRSEKDVVGGFLKEAIAYVFIGIIFLLIAGVQILLSLQIV